MTADLPTAELWEKRIGQDGREGLFALTAPPDLAQERIILFFPGAGTINIPRQKSTHMLSGGLNYLYQPGFRHIGLAYASETHFWHQYQSYHETDHQSWSTDIQQTVDKIFKGNIPDLRDCPEDERMDRLIDCAQRFSNVKIFGHCYGVLATTQLSNALNAEMDRLGYADYEKEDLLPEICAFGIAGITQPRIDQTRPLADFTRIDMIALNDTRLRVNFGISTYLEQSIEDRFNFKNSTEILELSDTKLGIYSRHPNEKIRGETKDNPLSHMMSTYLTPTKNLSPAKDSLPFLFSHLWPAMCAINADIPGFKRDQIIEQAEQSPDFAQIWQGIGILSSDDFSPLRIIQSIPHDQIWHASSLGTPFDHQRLQQEQSKWPDQNAFDIILGADFKSIGRALYAAPLPDGWQNITTPSKIEDALDLLLPKDQAASVQHRLSGFGKRTPPRIADKHLIVTEDEYLNILKPVQQAWPNNPEQEMLLSIVHDAVRANTERLQNMCDLSTFRRKRIEQALKNQYRKNDNGP